MLFDEYYNCVCPVLIVVLALRDLRYDMFTVVCSCDACFFFDLVVIYECVMLPLIVYCRPLLSCCCSMCAT